MDKEQVREIVLRVLAESQKGSGGLPLDIAVEVSARHVHLTAEAIEKLFGPGAHLTPKRGLSQPGQYLSEERVAIVTPKGRIENVAVLGPARSAIQVEISATDCRALGIKAPLRMSGDLQGAADVYLVGPQGMVVAKKSAIVAQAHIHMTPEQAGKAGVQNGQRVSVTLGCERAVTLEQVICRVSDEAALAMHIDLDEANACMLSSGTTARMVVKGRGAASESGCPLKTGRDTPETEDLGEPSVRLDEKVITEEIAVRKIIGKTSRFMIQKGVIVTPSAKDALLHAGVDILWQSGGMPL